MPTRVHAPGTDSFDLQVNYGGLRYEHFFGRNPTCHRLPSQPPPAAVGVGECWCPSCDSQGWFAPSPACRYWRAHCEECNGTRVWLDYNDGRPPQRRACELCAQEWPAALRWFRYSLLHPAAAARHLRRQATEAVGATEHTAEPTP